MKKKIIEVNAPEYYGDARLWVMNVCKYLENDGKEVLSVEPIVNDKHELVSIKVEVKED